MGALARLSSATVSYTHLDVYKRQVLRRLSRKSDVSGYQDQVRWADPLCHGLGIANDRAGDSALIKAVVRIPMPEVQIRDVQPS